MDAVGSPIEAFEIVLCQIGVSETWKCGLEEEFRNGQVVMV